MKLPLSFYQRETTQVAQELLGKRLVHQLPEGTTSGLIIETEAYLGIKDRAAHTFGGRQTERVASMWKAGGHAYVYFIYGMHFCMNVVTKMAGEPEAVLLRALYPVSGLELMFARRKIKGRGATAQKNLCSGPGKLCQAMGIDRSEDGLKFNGRQLWIEEGLPFETVKPHIYASPRVGIAYAQEAVDWPLRFRIHMDLLTP